MADHAHSDDPAVQAQLDRLTMLSPGRDVLGLERIAALMKRIGNPHHQLPPIFHVAGTNGKGSTCAFLRAALEAAGKTVHIYSSPHLVRFNERIRISGTLIDDAALAPLLAEILDGAEDIHPSFFEATTAAAYLAFARNPADAVIIEVGLGGRLDATNIIDRPLVCGIAQLAIDHQSFLGDTLIEIAREKAGIAKPDVPLVTMAYPSAIADAVAAVATGCGARLHPKASGWDALVYNGQLHYRDERGKLALPVPTMSGPHQVDNAALAIAMLRHQDQIAIPDSALRAAMGWAHWPARLQKLSPGPLAGDRDVWIDGCHNDAAGAAIAAHFKANPLGNGQMQLICGILDNKDAAGLLSHFRGLADRLIAVPVPGHPSHDPEAIAAIGRDNGMNADCANSLSEALGKASDNPILILGSLYLAGEALRLNEQAPQ
jgi:dihydrofolate synthase / folylpolyglutamate synthase